MRLWLYLFFYSLNILHTKTTIVVSISTKFNITVTTPENTGSSDIIPYKSIHVQYRLPSDSNRWGIVEIQPFIGVSKEKIRQITVHHCQVIQYADEEDSTWYDDDVNCNGARPILIYQWMSPSALSSFRVSDDFGFQLNKSKSIVVTVTYAEEQHTHQNQSGVILHISTRTPRFQLGTIVVGNKHRAMQFSCRALNYPRLLYAIQPLFLTTKPTWWRIYVIRPRNFGRTLVQYVLNSSKILNPNQANIEIISSDIFLVPGDYLIIECKPIDDSMCRFLIYYRHKNIPYGYFNRSDHTCDTNDHPELFKLLPAQTIMETSTIPSIISNIDRRTTWFLIGSLLFIVWISIILGCIIMRRIRGIVSYRPQPMTPAFSSNSKSTSQTRKTADDHHKTATLGDQIAQIDIEHMGLMS